MHCRPIDLPIAFGTMVARPALYLQSLISKYSAWISIRQRLLGMEFSPIMQRGGHRRNGGGWKQRILAPWRDLGGTGKERGASIEGWGRGSHCRGAKVLGYQGGEGPRWSWERRVKGCEASLHRGWVPAKNIGTAKRRTPR